MSVVSKLRAVWEALGERERVGLRIASTMLGLAVLWAIGIGPALTVLRKAPAQHTTLDAQLEMMQGLSKDAIGIQSAPKITYNDALKALESATKERFGETANLRVIGERATLSLKGAQPQAVAQWLAQARVLARAIPIEVRIIRAVNPMAQLPKIGASGLATSATAIAGNVWDGTITLTLYARP